MRKEEDDRLKTTVEEEKKRGHHMSLMSGDVKLRNLAVIAGSTISARRR